MIGDDTLEVIIAIPNNNIKKVVAMKKWSIGDLKRRHGIKPSSTVIANGKVLTPSNTLGYYDIKDKELLTVIPKSEQKDRTFYSNELFSHNSGSITKEASRLRDMRIVRLEGKPRSFNQFSKAFLKELESLEPKSEPIKTIFPNESKLSDEPLPIIW